MTPPQSYFSFVILFDTEKWEPFSKEKRKDIITGRGNHPYDIVFHPEELILDRVYVDDRDYDNYLDDMLPEPTDEELERASAEEHKRKNDPEYFSPDFINKYCNQTFIDKIKKDKELYNELLNERISIRDTEDWNYKELKKHIENYFINKLKNIDVAKVFDFLSYHCNFYLGNGGNTKYFIVKVESSLFDYKGKNSKRISEWIDIYKDDITEKQNISLKQQLLIIDYLRKHEYFFLNKVHQDDTKKALLLCYIFNRSCPLPIKNTYVYKELLRIGKSDLREHYFSKENLSFVLDIFKELDIKEIVTDIQGELNKLD